MAEQMRGETRKCERKKHRIVVIGAGIAGLSAADRLQSAGDLPFELVLLEASDRVGGRVLSAEFDGERVEMGATWIHGINGSPIYALADRCGALRGSIPWERMQGHPTEWIVKAEGGLLVDDSVLNPVNDIFKQLVSSTQRSEAHQADKLTDHTISDLKNSFSGLKSFGGYLRQGLKDLLKNQEQVSIEASSGEVMSDSSSVAWDEPSLQEGIFKIREYRKRIVTGADDLDDVDLESFHEYKEFPGTQISIPLGYSFIAKTLSGNLPSGTLKFGRKVTKICWTDSHLFSEKPPVLIFCADGSTFEADHAIITVSLGILKEQAKKQPDCESVQENVESDAEESESKRCAGDGLFEPPLPRWKLESIQRLGFGVVDKLFLKMEPFEGHQRHLNMQFIFHEHSENATSEHGVPWWMRKTFALFPTNIDSKILVTWLVGKEALEMESQTDEQIKEAVIKHLSTFGYLPTYLHQSNTKSKESESRPPEMEDRSTECKRKLPDIEESLCITLNDCERKQPEMEERSAEKQPGMEERSTEFERKLPEMAERSTEYERKQPQMEERTKECERKLPEMEERSTERESKQSHREEIATLREERHEKNTEKGPIFSVKHSRWGTDPLFRGSYTYVAVGSSGLDIDLLAEPLPHTSAANTAPPLQLLFAGEATHRKHYSTTHGAYLSGVREADRLLQHYGLSDKL